jgi:uncharacterized circularly permuted ATP-grasp superfamily protein
VSGSVIYQGKQFSQEIVDIDPPHDIYPHIGGTDIIRHDGGRYLVLDNLRTPQRIAEVVMRQVRDAALVIDIHASNIFLREIPQMRISQTFADTLVPLAQQSLMTTMSSI